MESSEQKFERVLKGEDSSVVFSGTRIDYFLSEMLRYLTKRIDLKLSEIEAKVLNRGKENE